MRVDTNGGFNHTVGYMNVIMMLHGRRVNVTTGSGGPLSLTPHTTCETAGSAIFKQGCVDKVAFQWTYLRGNSRKITLTHVKIIPTDCDNEDTLYLWSDSNWSPQGNVVVPNSVKKSSSFSTKLSNKTS